jgi:hypothetical protein
MTVPRKIVLHSLHGYKPALDGLVHEWIQEGVKYVGVIGVDASKIEDIIDELCVGDGSAPYFMLTASHGPDEKLEDAVFLAEQLSDEFAGKAVVVEF